MALDFLRLLLTQWTRDRADFELEKVENRQNIHQNVHEKWENPWNVGPQPEGSHCGVGGGGEIRIIETKVAKFA